MKLEKLVGDRFKQRPSDCNIDSLRILLGLAPGLVVTQISFFLNNSFSRTITPFEG